ncbi:MFS transporter [Dietzia timorensis]|uniref:Multidrug efflux protein YfmO n=1 Tax=Dietzia timorensis TaxID=499555 RepID=A0A173LK55_9ACTN|nr:MFS transporter [Dietzia timorensis]ANI90960.1 Multidrug efflux protein YfmO [Dietzia timorensis]
MSEIDSEIDTEEQASPGGLLKQPRAVWAVAFAATIAFMGIGLVDPILPEISKSLEASPSQAMLLFTSYLFITGICMFFTSWVSSRIGAKNTLLIGIGLVVVFAALCGLSNDVNAIIGLRGGWGLGNALFVSTALAAIISAATGGVSGAIILYEAALGLGLAVGPLLGGLLGEISWRGPFFGTAALMTIGFIGIIVLLPKVPKPEHKVHLLEPFVALRNPTLAALSIIAVLYNFAFFSLLAYSPFPIHDAASEAGMSFGALQLGFVFFGWGLAVALTSVFLAPRLIEAFGLLRTMLGTMGIFALTLAAMALVISSLPGLIVGVIVGGGCLGVLNTALTETSMNATDLPRAVASSTYSGVRFMGGAFAAWLAGEIADWVGAPAPYWTAAVVLVLAIALLFGTRGLFAHLEHHEETVPESNREGVPAR